MRLVRSFWLTAALLFLMVHQMVPHHHEQHSNADHFCAQETTEAWAKLVGGLSLDLGVHHLEWYHTPEAVHFAESVIPCKVNCKVNRNKHGVDLWLSVWTVEYLPQLRWVHPPNRRIGLPEPILVLGSASANSRAGRAPPVA